MEGSYSVVEPHHLDADPDLTYHPDADPDADPYSDLLFDVDPDADPDPTFHTVRIQIRIQILASKKRLKALKKC
jgi:hypothetical protein